MEGFHAFFGWVTGHEQLLSGLAAMVVIAGVALSPARHGLRFLLEKKRRGDIHGNTDSTTHLPPTVVDRPSIAVLPFKNLSDDHQQDFLADGMTEDIITGLALSRSLFVIDRDSSFTYKGKPGKLREISHELGVRTVLEGSVRRMGDALRVNAQLVDGHSGAHLWAQQIDRPLSDIFKVQDEITASIVAALTSHLNNEVAPQVARQRPGNLEAWELCQRARMEFSHNHDANGRRIAEDLYRKAVRKDADYAVGWISLGVIIAFRRFLEPETDSDAAHKEAQDCVERATKLSFNDPEVLAGYGQYLMLNGKPGEAVNYLERARHLNPYAVAYRAQLARALVNCGRAEDALAETEAVMRLSPRDPFRANHDYQLAEIYLALRRYSESEAAARRAYAGGLRGLFLTVVLANALGAQGRVEEACETVREGLAGMPGITMASIVSRYRDLGIEKSRLDGLLEHLKVCWPPELT